MKNMILGTVSVKGDRHSINQDRGLAENLNNGKAVVLAVSDGLGSRKHSELGSAALCESTSEAVGALSGQLGELTPKTLADEIFQRWLRKVTPYGPETCSATMLVAVLLKHRALMIRLGDGFLALLADGAPTVLLDRKENTFLNETDCLSGVFPEREIEYAEVEYEQLDGCILCSDGIEVGDMSPQAVGSFCREFLDGYRDSRPQETEQDITHWVENWTGTDDKTIVYAIPEGEWEH